MVIEKIQTTRLKNTSCMNPQIKNHKNIHELRLIRTNIFKILITNTICGENYLSSSWVEVKFINQEILFII